MSVACLLNGLFLLIFSLIQKKKKKKNVTHDLCHATCEMWNVTRDMWHLTHKMWGEVNLLSKYQLTSFYGFGMKVCWRYFFQRISDLTNYEGVIRTAPSTPGLVITTLFQFVESLLFKMLGTHVLCLSY